MCIRDRSDTAITLGQEIECLLDNKIPVQLLTDSKSLFDVISKGTRTSEKRTMLDIAASREAFRDKVISDIGFVRSNKNLADGLTKEMNQSALRKFLDTGTLVVDPDQWIIRNDDRTQRANWHHYSLACCDGPHVCCGSVVFWLSAALERDFFIRIVPTESFWREVSLDFRRLSGRHQSPQQPAFRFILIRMQWFDSTLGLGEQIQSIKRNGRKKHREEFGGWNMEEGEEKTRWSWRRRRKMWNFFFSNCRQSRLSLCDLIFWDLIFFWDLRYDLLIDF